MTTRYEGGPVSQETLAAVLQEGRPSYVREGNLLQLERNLLDVSGGIDPSLYPDKREADSALVRGVDKEGVAWCKGLDGSMTRLVAVSLTDPQYPTRLPFEHRPFAIDDFLLQVPRGEIGGFLISNDGQVEDGITRTVGGHFGGSQSLEVRGLAARPVSGFGNVEVGYNMTNATQAASDKEKMLAERMRLFESRKELGLPELGFQREHTRGILQIVSSVGNFPILFRPGLFFNVSVYDTRENRSNVRPDLVALQSRFRIKVDQRPGTNGNATPGNLGK